MNYLAVIVRIFGPILYFLFPLSLLFPAFDGVMAEDGMKNLKSLTLGITAGSRKWGIEC